MIRKQKRHCETDNCLAVLQRLCEEYNQEFDIAIAQNGTEQSISGKQENNVYISMVGRNLQRQEKVSSSNIINRLNIWRIEEYFVKIQGNKIVLPGKSKSRLRENAESIAKYGIWEMQNILMIFILNARIVTALGIRY